MSHDPCRYCAILHEHCVVYGISIDLVLAFDLSHADMSSTAFIEPLPVIDFVAQLLNRDISVRPLSDSDRVKV